MITLVHFHLLDPIMVGKKKTQDVQFYTEVMEAVQTLDAGRRSMYDPDEFEEEQRERAMRNKVHTLALSTHACYTTQHVAFYGGFQTCQEHLAVVMWTSGNQ